MADEDSSVQKSTKISLTGDVEKCGHCSEEDKKFRENQPKAGYDYEYVDVNSDQGQQRLKEYGVAEGQHVDIPITKVETCEWDPKNPSDKKCKTSDWKDEYWEDLSKGKLPE